MGNFLTLSVLVIAMLFYSDLPGYACPSIEATFSPSPQAAQLIVKTIDAAEDSIDMTAYSFSSRKVTEALIRAKKRGVTVRLVLDKSQARQPPYKAISALYNAGIPIRIDRKYHIMHNKYFVADGRTVESGSYNFTESAERWNAENVIVVKDDTALAEKYAENWKKLWNESDKYQPL